jgi:hypothetical protein
MAVVWREEVESKDELDSLDKSVDHTTNRFELV